MEGESSKQVEKMNKQEEKQTFKQRTSGLIMGEFRLKQGCGKHNTHGNVLCRIKGRKGQSVVFPGDILVCPVYMLDAFRDKFERLDASEASEDVVLAEQKASVPPIMKNVGKNKYNVYMKGGLKINDKPLTKDEALGLVHSYS
ncbi:MAG: hypothetical protein ACE5DQ_02815 [Candidatus Paceibacterota bacterium]